MKLDEILERLVESKGDIPRDLSKWEATEIESTISKMNDIRGKLEKHLADKKQVTGNIPEKKPPKLLTVKQAAKELQCSEQKLYHDVKYDLIKYHRYGGTIRFTYEDLNLFFVQTQTNTKFALCRVSNIQVDPKTSEVVPFERDNLYRIWYENRSRIYIFNAVWGKKQGFSKSVFKKYFCIAEDFHIRSADFNVGCRYS